MRLPIPSLLLIAAALLVVQKASAQSATSYTGCVKYFKEAPHHSTSRQRGMTTLSGIGGYCFESPYNHAPSVRAAKRR